MKCQQCHKEMNAYDYFTGNGICHKCCRKNHQKVLLVNKNKKRKKND